MEWDSTRASPKADPPERCKAYREFVSTLCCALCGVEGRTEAHHHGERGEKARGRKVGDLKCIPLCGPDFESDDIGCHQRAELKQLDPDHIAILDRARFETLRQFTMVMLPELFTTDRETPKRNRKIPSRKMRASSGEKTKIGCRKADSKRPPNRGMS